MKNVKQRMIEDMKLRGLAPRTQDRYLYTITAMAEHYHREPDQITEKQVRKYLLYLIESKGYAKTTFNIDLCAIKFLYRRTLGRTWMPAREDYLVPVRALSRLFRGSFLDSIRRQFKDIHLPKYIWQKDWVVHCKPAVQGTRTVLNYLARYIHRVAITNSRIISADNGKVTFRYKDSGGAQTKTMTVSAEEFIRRFLQHVLPAGVHKVRYYGLWSSSNRKQLRKIQQISTQPGNNQQVRLEEDIDAEAHPPSEARQCPHCQRGTLIWIGRLPRQGRAPP